MSEAEHLDAEATAPDRPAGRPRRIQLRRTKGWRLPAGAVKVDRTTRWGNPYVIHEHVEQCYPEPPSLAAPGCPEWSAPTAAIAAQLFRHAVLWPVTGQPEVPTPGEIAEHLAGRDLACWCRLDQPCHADVLLAVAAGVESGPR